MIITRLGHCPRLPRMMTRGSARDDSDNCAVASTSPQRDRFTRAADPPLAVIASRLPGWEGMATAGALLSVAYIAVLIVWLARQPPFAALVNRPARFRTMLGLILLVL